MEGLGKVFDVLTIWCWLTLGDIGSKACLVGGTLVARLVV